jgi:hypothetical protein
MLMLNTNSCSACLTLRITQLIVTDKGCQQGVEVGQGLGPGRFTLEGVEKIDDLAQGRAKVFGRCAFHFALDAFETVAQQIGEIPAHAVDRQQAEVMDVQVALGMGPPDLRRIDLVQPVLRRDV